MATCNLTIELDDCEQPRVGGESVTGTVIVSATGSVQCDALEVKSCWSTHGTGNIDSGDIDQQIVFQGQWEANQEYRYKFTLKTATWPPTYYGTLLNVSHSVRARARIPWSKDPTAIAEFPVVAVSAPNDLKPTESIKKSHSILGWVIGGLVIVLLLAVLSVFLLLLLIPLAIGAACYWFVRVFLPQQVTGSIEYTVEPKRVAEGETVRGQLRFTPKRSMTINSIQWTVTSEEKCVSGSGSDKKTHRHEIFKTTERLAESGELRVGQPQSFEFAFQVPRNSPPSLKFSNNELNWTTELRIDIAKWPDWVQTIPVTVTPSGQSIADSCRFALSNDSASPPSAEEAWFDDVLRQVERLQDDPENLRTVLDAVRDQKFTIRVDIDERLDEPPPTSSRESGTWMIAHSRRSDIELALVWPLPGTSPPSNTDNWLGQAVILGYDNRIDCLLMRVVPDSDLYEKSAGLRSEAG